MVDGIKMTNIWRNTLKKQNHYRFPLQKTIWERQAGKECTENSVYHKNEINVSSLMRMHQHSY